MAGATITGTGPPPFIFWKFGLLTKGGFGVHWGHHAFGPRSAWLGDPSAGEITGVSAVGEVH
jgi:hypothetical protein